MYYVKYLSFKKVKEVFCIFGCATGTANISYGGDSGKFKL